MTQKKMVLKYMQDFGSITQLDAIRDLGILRLAARIADLKAAGIRIKTETDEARNRYGKKVKFTRYSIDG